MLPILFEANFEEEELVVVFSLSIPFPIIYELDPFFLLKRETGRGEDYVGAKKRMYLRSVLLEL